MLKKIVLIGAYTGIIFLSLVLFSCLNPKKEPKTLSQDIPTDTNEIIRSYIFGLWSLADGNMLNNDGYFFQPDGTIRLVASEYSGEWNLINRDSLRISFQVYSRDAEVSYYRIDSLSAEKMQLSSKDGSHAYRKVPFGINQEGTVLQGFMGSLLENQTKYYEVEIPTAKEVSIVLSSDNPSITFRFFEKDHQLTSTGVQSWRGILTHGGMYELRIMDTVSNNSKAGSSYSIKVIGF